MSVNNMEKKSWPMLLDMTKEECKKTLRSLELSAYSKMISVFRAQGELTKEKRKLLNDLQSIFAISVERHRAEIRRAVNDEMLNTIAETLAGPNTNIEWTIEGRRLIPLMPRAPPQVAYTALATRMAQMYCGINAQLPNPCDTAKYGKLDDLGADMEATDSEDETEGLRYITESMIPQQYNADQGSYTTLPISEARLAKEKLKEKKENIEESNHEVPPSSPLHPSSLSSGSTASSGSQMKPHVVVGSEKRKRKRSLSSDHPPPHSPPPPPPPPVHVPSQPSSSTNGVPSGPAQPASTSIRQLPNIGPSLSNSSMKITVTGGLTRGTSGTSASSSSNSTQQKVILVSTSAASGTVGNIYQRSISVPILKSASQSSIAGIPPILGLQSTSQSTILKSAVSTPSASVGSSVMNKIRPRFSSSILSQGSSSLPGLPPRPPLRSRSNSLILQTEGESSGLSRSSSGPSFTQTSSISEPGGTNASCLNFIGANSLQIRPGPSLTPKNNIQVKQEGGKLIAHSMMAGSSGAGSSISSSTLNTSGVSGSGSVVGSRIIGRAAIPPSSSQGLYVVSTSSGTITVVTRTVASASISTPRVVTVNTINSSRPSIVRGPSSSSTLMSVGMNQKAVSTMRQTGSIRPVISGSKSNVIVVHKGTIGPGSRPVGLHGLSDISAKIIKSSQPGISGNISGSSGILSGTLVVKPSLSSKTISSTRDPNTVVNTSSVSSSNVTTTVSSSGNNLIVVDLNCDNTSTSQSCTSAVTSVLHTPGTISSGCSRNTSSLFASTSKSLSEASSLQKRDSSSSHEISTVSASSSLPSTFRVIKSPSLPSDSEDTGFEPAQSDLPRRSEDRMPISNLVTSSSDIKDSLNIPDGSVVKTDTKESAPSSLSLEEHEEDEEDEEEDNEWLKLGLEDEEEPEIEEEEEEEERGSEVDCEVDKVENLAEEESLENEADVVEDSPDVVDSVSEVTEGKQSKAGTSGDASVSSSTGTGNEKEGELQLLVEKAVEVLKDGDSDQARSLLYKAGFELIDSSSDQEKGPSDGFSISNIAGVSSSSAVVCGGSSSSGVGAGGGTTPLSSSTPLRDESSLGSVSELDPATGYFYSPSVGENSSEPTSNKADSPTPKEDDNVPEEKET